MYFIIGASPYSFAPSSRSVPSFHPSSSPSFLPFFIPSSFFPSFLLFFLLHYFLPFSFFLSCLLPSLLHSFLLSYIISLTSPFPVDILFHKPAQNTSSARQQATKPSAPMSSVVLWHAAFGQRRGFPSFCSFWTDITRRNRIICPTSTPDKRPQIILGLKQMSCGIISAQIISHSTWDNNLLQRSTLCDF